MSEIVLVSIIVVLSVVIVCEFICHTLSLGTWKKANDRLEAVNKEWKEAHGLLKSENIALRAKRLKKLESITITREGIVWNETKDENP